MPDLKSRGTGNTDHVGGKSCGRRSCKKKKKSKGKKTAREKEKEKKWVGRRALDLKKEAKK